jgi:uncharacterized protein with NRDE domain
MCLVALALGAHPRWRLVIAANRDEYHERPAAPLARWPDSPGLIAGRDLRSGGTWLGVREGGDEARVVFVTNYRVPGFPQQNRPSRGGLVTALLDGADPASIAIAPYNPFNLVVIAPEGAHLLANHPAERRTALAPGIHGVSNGAFDAPWPKTRQLNGDLARWLDGPAQDLTPLLAALAAETPDPPALDWDPHGPDPEPRLSPVFIRNPSYGTRCSTVLGIDAEGHGTIIERRFSAAGEAEGDTTLAFRWPHLPLAGLTGAQSPRHSPSPLAFRGPRP